MEFELANRCGNRIRTVFCKNKNLYILVGI